MYLLQADLTLLSVEVPIFAVTAYFQSKSAYFAAVVAAFVTISRDPTVTSLKILETAIGAV